MEKGVAFPISARDQFSGAFALLMKHVAGAESGFEGLARKLVATLSVGALGAFIKHTIDTQDELSKLSVKLNLTVEALAGWRHAANLAGVSNEGLEKAMKSLGSQMFDASMGLIESKRNFAALGIEIRSANGTLRNTDEVMLELADKFNELGNSTERTALAVKLLGKEGLNMLPFLAEGSGAIREMVEEGQRLNPVTAAAARQSEIFNDNLSRLRSSVAAVGIGFLNDLMPTLSDVSKIFAEEALSGDVRKTAAGFDELTPKTGLMAEALKALIVVGANVGFVLRGIATEIGGLAAQFVAFISGDFKGAAAIGRMMKEDAVAARAAFDAFEKKILAAGTASSVAAPKIRGAARAITDTTKAAGDAQREHDRLAKLDAAGWVKYIEETTKEYEEGLLDKARALDEWRANEAKMLKMSDAEWVKYIDALNDKWDQEARDNAAISASRFAAEAKQWEGFVGGIESAFRDAWDHIGESWKSALDVMKSAFKRILLDFIYQSLARPFVLNLLVTLGNAVGAGGLTNAILGSGTPGVVSTGLNLAGLAGAAGSILPGGAVGTAFGNIANMGASMLGASGSFASAIGSVASFLPVIGTVVAVAAMLHSIFGDKGENPNFRWLQGTGGAGLFGGVSTAGNYNFDGTALMSYIGGLDARFARVLGAEGTATASARLSAYTGAGLRSDGQPAQFAFPEGDPTAAEQIAKELLQSRYGILFEGIDAGIAQQIKEWSGPSTDLQIFIESMLGIVEGLGKLNITGLDIAALKAMQAEGEELTATFQRVAGTWAWFNDNFYTEAEKLKLAQKQVTDVFETLGLSIPKDVTAFRQLVESLDLSTEAGRAMWKTLMEVAPAFLTVTRAADGATTAIDDTTRALERQAEIQRQIEADVRSDRERKLAAIVGARQGLGDFLTRTLLDTTLTPLDPMQRLGVAKGEFESLLALARGGDLSAAGKLGGAAEAYLRIAREIFASGSGFVDIFNAVTGAVKGVDDRLAIDQKMLESTLGIQSSMAQSVEIQKGTYELIMGIAEGIGEINRKTQPAAATERR